MTWLIGFIGVPIALVLVSYLVEALRIPPTPPVRLSWAPDIPVEYLKVDGYRLRHLVTGDGPPLVLFHTLRTQLDLFQRIIPVLATRFRVHALDYPGHGYSDIPDVKYDADFFTATMGHALDRLELRNALVVGESIGGSIGLLLAARHHPAVARVIAINPYDYGGGKGLRRSSLLANVLLGLNNVPVLGATVSRLRQRPILERVFRGGVYRQGALPPELAREMYLVGNRPGHAGAFASLVRHWASWEAARVEYRNIDRPVLLIYGDHDWSRENERRADAEAIPGAGYRVIEQGGHFLALDAPAELSDAILAWGR